MLIYYDNKECVKDNGFCQTRIHPIYLVVFLPEVRVFGNVSLHIMSKAWDLGLGLVLANDSVRVRVRPVL
jgi:hypothetical protein